MSMKRRELLKTMGSAALLSLAPPVLRAQEQVARATRGMATPRIKDISVIEGEPAGTRLTVVKITTDQDGLYGYGCATSTQRADLVKPAVEKYLKPFLIGKTTDRIEDIWQSCYDSSYWKNGPVQKKAINATNQTLCGTKRPARGQSQIRALHDKPVFEPAYYVRRALKLFEVCRKELGDEIELLHDMHERFSPNGADH